MKTVKQKKVANQDRTLHDPSLFHFCFLSRGRAGDDTHEKSRLWNRLWLIVSQAWEWIHQKLNHSPPALEKPKINLGLRESLRIAGTDWLKNEKETLSGLLEVRLLLDSLFIQFGFWNHSDASLTAFERLKETVDEFKLKCLDEQNVIIGESLCYYAEITRGEENLDLSQILMLENHDDFLEEVVVINFEWGYLYLPAINKNPVAILSFRDKQCTESASWFINFILPRLALMHYKIDQEYHIYELERPQIAGAEYQLRQELKGREKSGDLKYLEKRIINLSEKQDQLIEFIGRLKQSVLGMETNLTNIIKILQEPVLKEKYQQLWSVYGENHSISIEQMNVDLNYFNSCNDEALLALRTLQAFIDVERGKNDRRLLGILGTVGIMISVIDGFSDEFTTLVKVIILGIGILIGSVIFLWGKKINWRLFKDNNS